MKNIVIRTSPRTAWPIRYYVTEFVRERAKQGEKMSKFEIKYSTDLVLEYTTASNIRVEEEIAELKASEGIIQVGETEDSYILEIEFSVIVKFYKIFWLAWNEIIGSRMFKYSPRTSVFLVASDILGSHGFNEALFVEYNKELKNKITFIAKWSPSGVEAKFLNLDKVIEEIDNEAPRWFIGLMQDVMHYKPEIFPSHGSKILVREFTEKILKLLKKGMSTIRRNLASYIFRYLMKQKKP